MGFVLFKELKTKSDVYVRSELVGIVRPMLQMGPGPGVSPMTGQRDQKVEGEYTELGLARGTVVAVDCVAAEALEMLHAADAADAAAADAPVRRQEKDAKPAEKKPDERGHGHGARP